MSPATQTGGAVKFQTNIPEIVSLAFADGREVTSQFSGDQVMFTLDDGRKLYLAPFVADRIRAAGVRAHEPFEICKREVAQGNRRTVEFQIRPLTGGRSPVQPSPAAAAPQYQPQGNSQDLTRQLEDSIAKAQAARMPPPPATAPDTGLAGTLAASGKAAVDAVLEIEKHARERGLTDFAFGADAVERFAVTLFIELNRRGSR
jgi:hypothetical protein